MKNLEIGKIVIGRLRKDTDIFYSGYSHSIEKWSIKFTTESYEYGIFRMFTKEEIDAIADSLLKSIYEDADYPYEVTEEEYQYMLKRLEEMRMKRYLDCNRIKS